MVQVPTRLPAVVGLEEPAPYRPTDRGGGCPDAHSLTRHRINLSFRLLMFAMEL